MSARVVVVTGASAGVGRATARAFAARGDKVALLARGADGLEAARLEIERARGVALAVPVDVVDAEAVERAADLVEERLGAIDVWVNGAMVSVFSPVSAVAADEVRRVSEVTYLGSVHGILAALARMAGRDRGTIIQVGSALAYRAIPLQAGCCAAKFAIRGFVDSLRCELLHDNSAVRIASVHLPALNTPQFSWVRTRLPRGPQPIPPIYQPEVAARAILWAAEHDRREVLVGYPTVATVFANKVAPGLLDRYLARTGHDAQQTQSPVQPDRRDNLDAPMRGDRGAHGEFDDRARERSLAYEVSTRRRLIGGIGGLVDAAGRRLLARAR